MPRQKDWGGYFPTRTKRQEIPPSAAREIRWVKVARGEHIGYQRIERSKAGSWWARKFVGGTGSKYRKRVLGSADDLPHVAADGLSVMSYSQALAAARQFCDNPWAKPEVDSSEVWTLNQCADFYQKTTAKKRSAGARANLKYSLRANILPTLGSIPITKLTFETVEAWHAALARKPARVHSGKRGTYDEADQRHKAEATTAEGRSEALRKRQATANRQLTTLKAMLSYCCKKKKVVRDSVEQRCWEDVEPFPNIECETKRIPTDEEISRVFNAAKGMDTDLYLLTSLGALIGSRFKGVAGLVVQDFDSRTKTLRVRDSKTKPYTHHLHGEAAALVESLVAGKSAHDHIVTNSGKPWGKGSYSKRWARVCKAAEVDPPISFNEFCRHSYGSRYIMSGGHLLLAAKQMGHRDSRMLERHYAHILSDYRRKDAEAHAPEFGIKPVNVAKLKAG